MKNSFLIMAVVFGLGMTGCSPQVDVEADVTAIRELTDVAWMEAGKEKDLDRWVSYHTEDALLMLPGVPEITGRDAIHALLTEAVSAPGWSSWWETTKIEVSRSGDLAYSYGPQENTVNDSEGKPVTTKLKWVATWKKQPSGSWKCAVLIISPDIQVD